MSLHALQKKQIEDYYGRAFADLTADEIISFRFDDVTSGFASEEIDGLFPEEPEKPQKFKLHTTAQFAVLQTQQWFIKGILPRAELAIVYGPPGSGKSFAVLDMVMAIARDLRMWCDYKVKPGKVTYICAEAPNGFRNRLVAYFGRHQVTTELPNFNIIDDVPNFIVGTDIKILSERIGQTDIIVVDTLSRVITGGDENNGKDMSLMIAHCQELSRSCGSLVILIHHSGKDADKGSRGWSGLLGAADTEIKVECVATDRTLTITKQKEGVSGQKIGFMLTPIVLGVDDDGDDITSCVFEQSLAEPRVYKKLEKLGVVAQKIMDALAQMPENPVMLEDLAALTIANMVQDGQSRDRRRDKFFQSLAILDQRKMLSVSSNFVYKI